MKPEAVAGVWYVSVEYNSDRLTLSCFIQKSLSEGLLIRQTVNTLEFNFDAVGLSFYNHVIYVV